MLLYGHYEPMSHHTKRQVLHLYSTEKRTSHNMKVFVEKTSSNVKNDKMTKTSKFLRFLMKFCILPMKISGDKVLFKFLSTKMLVHVLGIFVFTSCTGYGLILYPTQFIQIYKKMVHLQSSWVEKMSFLFSTINALTLMFLPSGLGNSLKNMDSNFLQNQNCKWPKTARLNIAGKGIYL